MLKPILSIAAITLAVPTLLGQQFPQDLVFRAFPDSGPNTDAQASRDVALGDFDRDGDLDLFVANLDQDNAFYLNDGEGNFTRELTGPLVTDGGNSRGIALGDIDGDGDLDIFVANSRNEANFLYENKGGLVFERRLFGPVATDIGNSRQAEFFDVDGDGDLDLYVTNFNFEANFLYINQGGDQNGTEGRFARKLTGDAATDEDSTYGLCFGDVDGDEDLDLFVTNHSDVIGAPGLPNWLYLNDGSGEFTRSETGLQSTDFNNSLACALADTDNDGDLDLFVGNTIGQHNQIFLNDGTGQYTSRPQSVMTIDRGKSIGVEFFDADGDGDLDAMVANRSPNISSEFYINLGDNRWARQGFGPLTLNRRDSYDVAIGDLDDDGRPDMVFANLGSGNDLYRNLGKQWNDLGGFLAGGETAPTLNSEGNFLAGEVTRFVITEVPVGSRAFFLVGDALTYSSFLGGTLVLDSSRIARVFMAENAGPETSVEIKAKIPDEGLPADMRIGFQAWIEDVRGPAGYTATNGLRVLTP